MKQVQYVLQFRGKGVPKPGDESVFVTNSSATAGTITTSIGAGAVDAEIKIAGGKAVFASEVRFNKDGTFVEDGTISFGDAGSITFSTRGVGSMGPSSDPDLVHGAMCWQVDTGTGIFAGATGIITSNFMLRKTGDVVDNQWGVIFLK